MKFQKEGTAIMAVRHIRPPIRAKNKEIILAERLVKAKDRGPNSPF
jgi:hypothetical protein